MSAKLADLLKDPEKTHNIEVGNVYKILLSKSDGLNVPDNKESLLKYFIVIGIAENGDIYGGLLISSEQPKNVSHHISMYQYKVKYTSNTFLKWDSWVNCTKIFKSSKNKLNHSNFLGCLDSESTYFIIVAILDENNPTITNKERKRYNISLPENEY